MSLATRCIVLVVVGYNGGRAHTPSLIIGRPLRQPGLLAGSLGNAQRSTVHPASTLISLAHYQQPYEPRDIPSLTIHNKLPTSKCLGKSGTDARPFGSEAGQPLSD
ncbi:hypothetical protein FFLO_02482 [Filobasidium floriforme]|uniref:Uncharacterized protein n=1 Tax=Filobasidium floriforme TaxID=5210 RepID=A0A8K0JMP2_9TREE|nr:hypothetical protein FFLO_02482 [Filobasidium floriforme]